MHYHYMKYFTFDALTDEQERRVREIREQYGGDVIAIGDAAWGGKLLAICVTDKEALSNLEKEARGIGFVGFRREPLLDRQNECDDEACINHESRDNTKRTK